MLLRTAVQLGLRNDAAVLAYRLALKRGWLDVRPPPPPPLAGAILREELPPAQFACSAVLADEVAEVLAGKLRLFANPASSVGCPPDWLRNPLSGNRLPRDLPWWRISDFSKEAGDIKGIWELSRFDWIVVLARYAVCTGDMAAVLTINNWVADWLKSNIPYFGPNWKCGQETSIRLMQTLLAARLTGQDREPEQQLKHFAETHLARIARTTFYSDAQANNHAVSEAFALFAGGAWLARVANGTVRHRAESWSREGRLSLEKNVERLVFRDGGFSQYSVNYHRVLLDTLAQVESWRRHLALPDFSPAFYARAAAATRWLAALVNANSGDAPNLGANDGARVYRLDDSPYRDHRPSVQLAAALFCKQAAYETGPWDQPLAWLGLEPPAVDFDLARKRSRLFPHFGLALLNPNADGSGTYAFVRVPKAQFRPSQADPLHFDLWTQEGHNLLRDGGSFSYTEPAAACYFSGVRAHNTIEFDHRQPMPRISQFLFGDWISGEMSETTSNAGGKLHWSGYYEDAFGSRHRRTVRTEGSCWVVEDLVEAFSECAVLRWRLPAGSVRLSQHQVDAEGLSIDVEGDGAPATVALDDGWESRLYDQRNAVPQLVAAFGPSTRKITSRIRTR